ncbi:helix-turn-helix domain-containing protein [Acinetobacter sp. c3-l95]|uniref:helix-turn-helix domain-containing protein n=1 Tax=Acinetobacter sp. c3-l95 TaxID=3342804 RepID=UPI0035B9F14E
MNAINPEYIKAERKRLGLTQQQVADICQITRIQWGRLERGQSKLGGRVLKSFIDLGANLNFLLTGDEYKTTLVGQVQINAPLTENETVLIQLYQQLGEEKQKHIIDTIKLFLKSP